MPNHLKFEVPTQDAARARNVLASFDDQVHAIYFTPAVRGSENAIPNGMMSTMYLDTDFTMCDVDHIMFNAHITVATTEVFEDVEDTLS